MSAERRTSNRGFASMDEEKQRRIASKGGRSVPNEKRSFSQNPSLAAEAGRKGGQASHGGPSGSSGEGGPMGERSSSRSGSERSSAGH